MRFGPSVFAHGTHHMQTNMDAACLQCFLNNEKIAYPNKATSRFNNIVLGGLKGTLRAAIICYDFQNQLVYMSLHT